MGVRITYLFVLGVWATTPLGINWTTQTLTPLTSVTARLLLSLVLVVVLAPCFGVRSLQWRANWRLYMASAFGICPGMVFVYWGAPYLPSGLVSVLFGLSPFFVGVLSSVILSDRSMTMGRYVAIMIALLGLGIIALNGGLTHPLAGFGVLLQILAAATFGVSSVLVKRYAGSVLPMQQLVGSLLCASVGLTMVWLLVDRQLPTEIDAKTLGSLVYLAVVGSFFGFLGYFYLIQRISVNLVAIIPLITPALAIWLGFVLNGEAMTGRLVGGSLMIVFALALFTWFKPSTPSRQGCASHHGSERS